MKKIFISIAAMMVACAAIGQPTTPSWLRQHSISPDGSRIAFSYQGDIFTVDIKGGKATQITSNEAHDTAPIWTPDGKEIVFSSDREKGTNIYKVAAEGGTPVQLTYRPAKQIPLAITPDGHIIFKAMLMPDTEYSGFPQDFQLYEVSLNGGRPRLFSSLPISRLDCTADGRIIYEDYKGYEDEFRKHHTSSVTRDIWLYTPAEGDESRIAVNGKGKFKKLTDYAGEDRNPVFLKDGKTFYYLSERDGKNSNIYKSSIDAPEKVQQITHFEKHPVRYLNLAENGTLTFSWNGDLYRLKEGEEAQKIEITVAKDFREAACQTKRFNSRAEDIAISPDGQEIAFVNRGDVFVTAPDLEVTQRITDTPEQERGVAFSKDGKTVYFASERNGHWGIWSSTPADKKEHLSFALDRKEELVTEAGVTCFQPAVSPDGKWLSYLRNRTDLIIRNIKSGKEKVLMEGVNYSYMDGDQAYAWSPDSKHMLCTWHGDRGWNNEDIALIDIESGKITNLTESGYGDNSFRWALGGKAMTWESDKNGFRSHGSWGSENDIYIMFFDQKALTDFAKSENDEKVDKFLIADDKKAQKEEKKDSIAKEEKKAIKLDLDRRHERTFRLTRYSGRMGDYYLTEDGSKLYYIMRLEKSADLCMLDLKEGDIKVIQKGVFGSFYPTSDGKSVYFLSSNGISKMDPASGSMKKLSFSGEYDYRPAAERRYIYDHVCKQVAEKFYDPSMRGMDWDAYCDNYRQFLPYIDNNADFTELLSELLGELNGSHTGARFFNRSKGNLGALGFFNDYEWTGDGLKIKEIITGGALDIQHPEIKAGDVITAINGHKILADEDWTRWLLNKGNERIQLTIDPVKGKEKHLYIRPDFTNHTELYKRWVKRNEDYVWEKTGGKVGYVHVEGMDSPSFREVYSKLLGKYRSAEAVIVDTRHNGGGWLHDDLATLLSGKAYIEFAPRGHKVSTEPYNKWNKPSCVLIGEDNYSDASGFPYVYKTLGIGKLIGAPVPGTMTAVWWETQVDPTIVFGIPQVGSIGIKEGRYLENLQVEPDILVYNEPASVLNGKDMQLDAAIEEMMKTIEKRND